MPAFVSDLGRSDGTSYISVAQADNWYLGTAREPDWAALTVPEKEAALMAATFQLETLSYAGDRCSPSSDDPALPQALQWPRSNATCRGIAAACDMLPREVIGATAYLALELHANPQPIGGGIVQATGPIQSQTLGALSQSFYAPSSDATKVSPNAPLILQRFPFLVDLLGCWSSTATGGSGLILRVRA
jgi:hypothetical protein